MNPYLPFVCLARRNMGRMDGKRLATQVPAAGVHQINHLPYLGDAEELHQLDVYSPVDTAKPLPLLIDIHGGALVYGTKELNKNYATTLASYGFTVASLSYRLAPEASFEQQVQDILAAFRWIYQHAWEFPIDLDKAYLTGDSAGALLAVYATMTNESPRLQSLFHCEGCGLRFTALGLVSGLYYMLRPGLLRLLRPIAFGSHYQRQPYLPAMDLEALPEAASLPPCYLVSSEEDALLKQTMRFERQLTRMGVRHQCTIWPKQAEKQLEHVFSIAYPNWPQSRAAMQEMADFFAAVSAEAIAPAASLLQEGFKQHETIQAE